MYQNVRGGEKNKIREEKENKEENDPFDVLQWSVSFHKRRLLKPFEAQQLRFFHTSC